MPSMTAWPPPPGRWTSSRTTSGWVAVMPLMAVADEHGDLVGFHFEVRRHHLGARVTRGVAQRLPAGGDEGGQAVVDRAVADLHALHVDPVHVLHLVADALQGGGDAVVGIGGG